MHKSILLALWAGISFVLYKIVASVLNSRRHAAAARRLGCQPAYNMSGIDPLGLDNILKLLRADKEQRLPQFLKDRMDNLSTKEGKKPTTVYQNVMGAGAYFTVEPRNIQAILATQFKDFGLGERRNGNFFPLLGAGIVSVPLTAPGTRHDIAGAFADVKVVFNRR